MLLLELKFCTIVRSYHFVCVDCGWVIASRYKLGAVAEEGTAFNQLAFIQYY